MHKEVIETRGPAFTTVEVREFMENQNEDIVKPQKIQSNSKFDNVIGEIVG
jgi:hypothetical protein